MHWRERKTTALLVAVALFFAALFTTCSPTLGVDRGKPANSPGYSLKAPEQERHDVDIISVDFDPPLNKDQIATASLDSITLLVAIDNRGNSTEKDLSVEAKLMGEREDDVIETKTQRIDALAPGEAKVIKFPHFGKARARTNYLVQVEVTSVTDKSMLIDKSKLIRLSFEPDSELREQ